MRTTLDLPEDLLREAMKTTHIQTKIPGNDRTGAAGGCPLHGETVQSGIRTI